jgi:uncharacterized protein YjiS (DUF1127 family)
MINAWTRYRTYRRTLSELRALSTGSLRDLDMLPRDLKTIAHRAVYGG